MLYLWINTESLKLFITFNPVKQSLRLLINRLIKSKSHHSKQFLNFVFNDSIQKGSVLHSWM